MLHQDQSTGFIAFPFLASSVMLQPDGAGAFRSRILVKVRKQPFVLAFPFCRYLFLSFQYPLIKQHVAGSASLTSYNQWLHFCCKKESLWAALLHLPYPWACSPGTFMLKKASPIQLCPSSSEMGWLKVYSGQPGCPSSDICSSVTVGKWIHISVSFSCSIIWR